MLSRRSVLSTALAAAVVLSWSGPVRADDGEARAFIQKLADDAMKTVAVKNIANDERNQRFRSLFVEAFDLPEVGRLVLARYWRVATPAQQQEFLRLFEDIQVYTWAKRFSDYAGDGLEILGSQAEGEGDLLVDSRIKRSGQDPIAVAWRVHQTATGWQVLDIKVEGTSMALTHRSEYGSVIQASGGQVEGLLAAMRKKAAQMKADSAAAP